MSLFRLWDQKKPNRRRTAVAIVCVMSGLLLGGLVLAASLMVEPEVLVVRTERPTSVPPADDVPGAEVREPGAPVADEVLGVSAESAAAAEAIAAPQEPPTSQPEPAAPSTVPVAPTSPGAELTPSVPATFAVPTAVPTLPPTAVPTLPPTPVPPTVVPTVPPTPVPPTVVPTVPPTPVPPTAVPVPTPVPVPPTPVPAPPTPVPPPPTAIPVPPTPVPAPPTPAPVVNVLGRAGPPGVVSQIPASAWAWLDAHGWRVDWRQGPGPGRVSEAQYATNTIVIWYDTRRSDTIWAGAFAHELGHAVSWVHFGSNQMNEWNRMRGVASWRWVPGTPNDFSVGEGDFAEAFMSYLLARHPPRLGRRSAHR